MSFDKQDRFWAKVQKTDECWIWQAAKIPNGYGMFDTQMAHRVSYEMAYGPIPDGRHLKQICKDKLCVRPEHLTLQLSGEDRFWAKVNKTESCWFWTAALDRNGYGKYGLGRRQDGIILAHRQAWILLKGPIPEGKDLLHSCDNPSCVNPEHLSVGDQVANNLDRHIKGRTAKGETKVKSHKLTPSQVLEIRSIIAQRSVVNVRAAFGSDDRFTEIAKKFGVSEATIRDIHKRRIWKHI